MEGAASSIWVFAIIIGPILLGLLMVVGVWQWRHRDRRLDSARDAGTRQVYDSAKREARSQGE